MGEKNVFVKNIFEYKFLVNTEFVSQSDFLYFVRNFFLGLTKILAPKTDYGFEMNFKSRKNYGSENFLSPDKIWVQKKSGSKKIVGPKTLLVNPAKI